MVNDHGSACRLEHQLKMKEPQIFSVPGGIIVLVNGGLMAGFPRPLLYRPLTMPAAKSAS
jgi:hypothetical protein